MVKKLVFNSLEDGHILSPEFKNFIKNNEITFSSQGVAIAYAPNGGGKTTITNICKGKDKTIFEGLFDGKKYSSKTRNALFHVISDHISRNIIKGTTDDFVLGDNIKNERKKKEELDVAFSNFFSQTKSILKLKFFCSKKNSPFIESIKDPIFQELISTFAKQGAKLSDLFTDNWRTKFNSLKFEECLELPENQLNFFLKDMSNADSIIKKIIAIPENKITYTKSIKTLECNKTAISILSKYKDMDQCIVCDTTGINPEALISSKSEKNDQLILSLNSETKSILEEIIDKLPLQEDPFRFKEDLMDIISSGKCEQLKTIKSTLEIFQTEIEKQIQNSILDFWQKNNLEQHYKEYTVLHDLKLVLSEDDELLIANTIKDTLDRDVILARDSENNVIIKLDDVQLLEKERDELPLSTGEQNFISLTFELLKARNAAAPIIILDDPISSSDSIYKNKIAFCILKILDKKQILIFTHNLELIRLLDVQKTHCFNAYFLQNNSGNNGFIPINETERDIVLYFDKLLSLLRTQEIDNYINDTRLYMFSLIPFMRALVKIMNFDPKIKNNITKLMHGCLNDQIDLTEIYNSVFNKQVSEKLLVTAQDIISIDVSSLNFFSAPQYPLLEKTLHQTLVFLYLRLRVEKTLHDKYPEQTKDCEQLGDYINKALTGKSNQSFRIRLTSKKTLLNEFNHYEGNFNLFQPALDISENNLEKEKEKILSILSEIKQ